MFWYDLMKKKKSKYKIMNKVSKLVDEHNKLNAKESCNRRNELREKVKSLYEQMDDIEREIHEMEQMRFLCRGCFIYCDFSSIEYRKFLKKDCRMRGSFSRFIGKILMH